MPDAELKTLYRDNFVPVASWIVRHGGTREDAKDVFQDALIIYYEKSRENDFEITKSPAAYIFGVARNLWRKKIRNSSETQSIGDSIEVQDAADLSADPERLLAVLQRTGNRCLELLTSFYYDQLPLDKIAETFGLSSLHSASAQKYKCLEKVRRVVQEKSMTYESFVE